MTDQRNTLQSLFQPNHRYSNFGEAIIRMHVQGFRCHSDTVLEIGSPITAFCGLNGTGKSTLLQMAAVAYRNQTGYPRRYVKNFIIAGKLDSKPFTPTASVRFEYLQPETVGGASATKSVTVSRGSSNWRGYKRQPERRVYFAGVGLYLPRVEEWDSATRHASTLVVDSTTPLSIQTRNLICQILGSGYDAADENNCTINGRSHKVVTVARNAAVYSELNMGCGEGRIYHIVRVLEALPNRSLVLLEEPEISLHPSSQHNFGRYLIDVCVRRRHQVFLTTHSEYLLKALPSASRIYIDRAPDAGIRLIPGITTAEAVSLMTLGNDKALHVLVEDNVAVRVLSEIIRRADPTFLKTIDIHPSGDTKTIQSVMKVLKETGLPVAAVRDGDKQGDATNNIFKLPGSRPPEKELLDNMAVRHRLNESYGIDVAEFLATEGGTEHHAWFGKLATKVMADEGALIQEAARTYATNLPETETDALTNQLKEAVRT